MADFVSGVGPLFGPDFVVVTGLSGSGKSQAVKVLEEILIMTKVDEFLRPLVC